MMELNAGPERQFNCGNNGIYDLLWWVSIVVVVVCTWRYFFL